VIKKIIIRFKGLMDTVQSIREMNKIHEFDPTLTEEQKKTRKQFLIFRTDPSLPDDEPKLMSYYIGKKTNKRLEGMRANVS
jgi:hypothetical protein